LGTVRGGTDLPIHEAVVSKKTGLRSCVAWHVVDVYKEEQGSSDVPCGTPDATGFVDDKFPSSTTVWVQSDKKS
jgi:hypothetical protein